VSTKVILVSKRNLRHINFAKALKTTTVAILEHTDEKENEGFPGIHLYTTKTIDSKASRGHFSERQGNKTYEYSISRKTGPCYRSAYSKTVFGLSSLSTWLHRFSSFVLPD